MKKVIAIVALAALAGSAYAQLSPLPPSSVSDGVSVQSLAGTQNAGSTHWEATPGLATYKFASDGTLTDPNTLSPDNRLGLHWASTSAAVNSHLSDIVAKGGTIRAIFLGESAGWLNDFGYSYSGNPAGAGSYTVFSNVQALSGTSYPVTVTYGDSINVSFGKGAAANFDFWLNGRGTMGYPRPAGPTFAGGVYTVFDQPNSVPYNPPGNVRLTSDSISVNTWLTTTSGSYYGNVDTYLVSIEDWSLVHGSDKDYNDFMFALQFFKPDGTPDQLPVPEPSTYGLIGAAGLIGLVMARRFKSKK